MLDYLMSLKRVLLKSLQVLQRLAKFKKVPGAPKLYVLYETNSSCVLRSSSSAFYLVPTKLQQIILKRSFYPRSKKNVDLNFLKMWH